MIDSPEEFIKLRYSEIKEEYQRAAEEEASLKVWLSLIQNHPEMREWVAHNKTIPTEILRKLIDYQDSNIRTTLASKRKLPEDLQLILTNDPDESVRNILVYNKKATKKVIEKLCHDSWEVVSKKAKTRLSKGEYN